MTDYRTTYSWRESLDLAPHLVRLAEALPDHEQSGLTMQLQQIMLDLPAAVAQDLAGDTALRLVALVRLQTAIELIDRVYPALDTAEVRSLLGSLEQRLSSDSFTEVVVATVVPAPAPEPPTEPELTPQQAVSETLIDPTPPAEPATDHSEPATDTNSISPVAPAISAPEPANVSVSTSFAPPITVAQSAETPASDPATINVQPNSLQ